MSDYFENNDDEKNEEIVEIMYCTICKTHYEYRNIGKSEKCKCVKQTQNAIDAMNHIFGHFKQGDKK